MNVNEVFGVPKRNGFVVGCEFEIEGIGDWVHGYMDDNDIQVTVDPSLREYNGSSREFITCPTTLEKAVKIHDDLYNKGKVVFVGPSYSDRCSIHAHVNFSDLEVSKAKQFILLYALLEPFFFKMVD